MTAVFFQHQRNCGAAGYDLLLTCNNSTAALQETTAALEEKYGIQCSAVKCDMGNEKEVLALPMPREAPVMRAFFLFPFSIFIGVMSDLLLTLPYHTTACFSSGKLLLLEK